MTDPEVKKPNGLHVTKSSVEVPVLVHTYRRHTHATHTRVHAHAHTRVHAHMHARTHTNTHVRTNKRTHKHLHTITIKYILNELLLYTKK